VRVLISDATSYKAVVVAAFIKRHYPSVEVFTCDWRRASRMLHTRWSDRHFLLARSPAEGAGYKDELRRLVIEQGVDLLLPLNSREMDVLVRCKAEFGGALAYWGDEAAFRVLNWKDDLHALALECGVRTPERFEHPAQIRVPAVAKPVASAAAKGVRYLLDPEDLAAFERSGNATPDYLLQEYVPGAGVGYSVFAKEGEVLKGYGHRRLAEYPVTGGSSVYRESFSDERMAQAASRLVRKARWSGFAMFEFKLTPGGELYLLEVNPRIWGSINQGLRNGVNFFEPLLGPARARSEDVRTYFSPLVYVSLLLYALRGELRPALAFLRNRRSNRADVSVFGDPRGYFASLLRSG
jgi:hypothetical protein